MVVLNSLYLVLLAGLGFVLVRRFRATRNTGYLVLGVPLVLWSFVWWPVNLLVRTQIDRLARSDSLAWPLSLVEGRSVGEMVAMMMYGQRILEVALLIVGFVWLGRQDARVGVAPSNSELQSAAGSLRSPAAAQRQGRCADGE